jgi:hypothetical protein
MYCKFGLRYEIENQYKFPEKVNKKKKKNEDKKKNCKFGLKDKIEKKNQNFIKGPRTKLYKSKE